MARSVARVVVVSRPTDYQQLIARHASHAQAKFYLESRGRRMDEVEADHHAHLEQLQAVQSAIPLDWRRTHVWRADLDRFLFEPEDTVAVVGPDGLVANVAKYLSGQAVLGFNPAPGRYDGVLVRHEPRRARSLFAAVAADDLPISPRTMVQVRLDDGQRLLALNEVFIGHRSHQSARYRLLFRDRAERQSSSGVIVSTGTGATGWALSINRTLPRRVTLPQPEEPRLAFFVREAFPSQATGADLVCGVLEPEEPLRVVSALNEGGVIFGDGIEADFLDFGWGAEAVVSTAGCCLRLVADA